MIDEFVDLYTMEPMKYQSLSPSYTKQERQAKIDFLVKTGNYIYSQKTDGNWCRTIWSDGDMIMQSRGISKKTGEYGRLETKVVFADSIRNAFKDTTVLIGELYLDGGVDKDVGSILRCLDEKALARQKGDKVIKYRIFDCFYYEGVSLLNAPITERIKYLPMAAQAINNELVSYGKYYEAKPETFWDKLKAILDNGGEGLVLYRKDMTPCEGRTPAGQTLKVKQELGFDIDAFITGVEPAKMDYTGKEIETWEYWFNEKTNEKLQGKYYLNSYSGEMLKPVTKSWWHDMPGAIICSVMVDGEPQMLCKCANLTDELSIDLRDHYELYENRPVKIQGMMISKDRFGNISVRHPKLMEVRNYDDIDLMDCNLEKVLAL